MKHMAEKAYFLVLFMVCAFVSSFAGQSENAAIKQGDDLLDEGNGDFPFSSQSPLSEEEFEEFLFQNGLNSEYSGEDTEGDPKIVTARDKSLAAIYGIITIVGLLSNCVVFFVIFGRNEINRTVTAIYVVQLALADSIFLLSLPMFIMQQIMKSWTLGSATCTIGFVIKFLNYYAGIFFLTAMSVDRYIAVAFSTTANQLRTKRTTYIVCAIVWTLSTVMTLPMAIFAKTEKVGDIFFCRLQLPGHPEAEDSVIYYNELKNFDSFENNGTLQQHDNLTASLEYEDEYEGDGVLRILEYEENLSYNGEMYLSKTTDKDYECVYENKDPSLKSWLVANFVIGFLIPFLIISTSYFLILKRLRISENKIGATKSGKRTAIVRKRVTRTVAALVICFVICWLPYHLFRLTKIQGFKSSVSVCQSIEEYLLALGYSNSAINPILYTFMGHNFMDRFRESIDITKRRLSRGSMASMTAHVTKSHSDHGKDRSEYMSRTQSNQTEWTKVLLERDIKDDEPNTAI